MVAVTDFVPHMARITGLSEPNLHQIARRLKESGVIPARRGAASPPIKPYQLAKLILGAMADVPAKDVISAATTYYSLSDPNGNRLGDVLVNVIDTFKGVNDRAALALRSRLEIDCGYPRACLSMETTEGQVEILYGVQRAQWEDLRVRRSMTISGKALFDLAVGLHFNRWDSESCISLDGESEK